MMILVKLAEVAEVIMMILVKLAEVAVFFLKKNCIMERR